MSTSKVAPQTGAAPLPAEHITQSILVFRGHKVLLDEDLAALYGVQTGALVQAVKRNSGRFPADFMFQLIAAEWTVLRSRIVIPTSSRGGRRFAPYVFTEQGVAMLSSVLGSERAITINGVHTCSVGMVPSALAVEQTSKFNASWTAKILGARCGES